MYIFMKVFFKKNLFTWLSLFKLNNLKVTHNLYSQCLTQTLSKTIFFPVRREYILIFFN